MILLDVQDLEPGMVLCRDVVNEKNMVALTEGTVLTAPIIEKMKTHTLSDIFIEDSEMARQKDFFHKYQRQIYVTEGIFREATETGSVPVKLAENLVSSSLVPMVAQSGILDYLYQSGGKTTYEYQHAMNVSVMSGLLAKWMHYDESAIEEIMMAGLLHDIGKTRLPQNLAEKKGLHLNAHEEELYHQHTKYGYQLLNGLQLSENVRQAVLHHHEHIDCSGYPANLVNDQIHPYAKIIAVMNKYDNKVTPHPGSNGETPFAALKEITQKMFSTLETKTCIAFIHNLKESLIGSRVLLSDYSKGTVVFYSKDDFQAAPMISLDENHILMDLNARPDLKIIDYKPANN